jgi:branched-chain amino acid transport system substrate-binding protein
LNFGAAAQATNKNAHEGEEAMKSLRILAIAAVLACTQASAGEKSIKIGILGDQSGPYSDLGGAGSVLAAQMAADDYGGKALGKPIEIVAADMQNKPDVASSIARRWFDVEGVDAIADVPLTSVALAVQSVAREKKKILLITAAASADLTGKACSPYTVHWMDDTRALSVGTGRAVVPRAASNGSFSRRTTRLAPPWNAPRPRPSLPPAERLRAAPNFLSARRITRPTC